jgi:hypothetical protein
MNLPYRGLVPAKALADTVGKSSNPLTFTTITLPVLVFMVFPLAVLGLLANGVIWLINRF